MAPLVKSIEIIMSEIEEEKLPGLWVATMPVIVLLGALVALIVGKGADSVQALGPWVLLLASAAAMVLSVATRTLKAGRFRRGFLASARQVAPSLPILLLIGTVSATWMLSGVVPIMIEFGLKVLDPNLFLMIACVVSALISVLTGSSWTTIATIGVAFMGIGLVMGYSPGWIAGAIISGAYFGDKISPLSDTTVLAATSSGVNLFSHIRYMMLTTVPSMVITVGVFAAVGLMADHTTVASETGLIADLQASFNLTPWLLLVPAVTGVLIAFRLNAYLTLGLSSLCGLVAMLVFQPSVISSLAGTDGVTAADMLRVAATSLTSSTELSTQSPLLDSLVATGGMAGMMPTVWLVTCAMVFGGVMLGTGMLASITAALTRRLRTARSTVSATVVSGLGLNACTGDQYLSIIISSNIYKSMYESNGLERRLLSRTVEDSVSVTSVLIPWNSCGLTQSTVLGVATLTYLPCCIFNLISPLMSLAMAWIGLGIRKTKPVAERAD